MKTTEIKFVKVTETSIGFGLGGNTRIYVAIKGDKIGYLPNESTPYMPIGGIKALKSVESILNFK